MQKKIAFFIQSRTHYLEAVKTAERLNKFYHIIFIFSYPLQQLNITEKVKYEYKVIGCDVEENSGQGQHRSHNNWPEKCVGYLKNIASKVIRCVKAAYFNIKSAFWSKAIWVKSRVGQLWVSIKRIYQFYKKFYKHFDSILSKNRIDLFILAEGNSELYSEAYIKVCQRRKIPTIILPYTICSPSEPAQFYYNSLFHQASQVLSVISRGYKKWTYRFKGKLLQRLPLIEIITQKLLGVEAPQPWIQESSTADALIAESEMTKKHYINLGLPEKQIYCLGNINHDILYESLKKREELKLQVLEELKLKGTGKKIITFALFPNLVSVKKAEMEFKTYSEIIEFILKELSKIKNAHVILCLHPSLNYEKYKCYETDNIKISTRKTSELVAITDLYIASISATIKWAITMGVPVINYDVYKLNYNDYERVTGVIHVQTKADFASALKELSSNEKYYLELKEKQMSISRDWGIVDGKFTERLKGFIDNLIDNKQK